MDNKSEKMLYGFLNYNYYCYSLKNYGEKMEIYIKINNNILSDEAVY